MLVGDKCFEEKLNREEQGILGVGVVVILDGMVRRGLSEKRYLNNDLKEVRLVMQISEGVVGFLEIVVNIMVLRRGGVYWVRGEYSRLVLFQLLQGLFQNRFVEVLC